MKAKTISGDIINVIPKQYDGYVGYIEPATGYYYDAENLTIVSFDDDFNPDYWTRLEHTYAGMAMQGILINEKMTLDLHRAFGKDESLDITISDFAIDLANTLVKKLKEKEERK